MRGPRDRPDREPCRPRGRVLDDPDLRSGHLGSTGGRPHVGGDGDRVDHPVDRADPTPPRRPRPPAGTRRPARGRPPGPPPSGRERTARPPGPRRRARRATRPPDGPTPPTPGTGRASVDWRRASQRPLRWTASGTGTRPSVVRTAELRGPREVRPVERGPQRRGPGDRLGQDHRPGTGPEAGDPGLPMEGAPPGTAPLLEGAVGHGAGRGGRAPVPPIRTGPHDLQAERTTDERRLPGERLVGHDPGVRGGSAPDAGGEVPPRAAHRRTGPRRHRRCPRRGVSGPGRRRRHPRSWTGGADQPGRGRPGPGVTPPARGERRPPWCRPPQGTAVRPGAGGRTAQAEHHEPVCAVGSAPRPAHASRPGSVGPPRPACPGSPTRRPLRRSGSSRWRPRRVAPGSAGPRQCVEPDVIAVRRPACTGLDLDDGHRGLVLGGTSDGQVYTGGQLDHAAGQPDPHRLLGAGQPTRVQGRPPLRQALGLPVDLRPGVRPVRKGPGPRSRPPGTPGARRIPSPSRASANGSPTDPTVTNWRNRASTRAPQAIGMVKDRSPNRSTVRCPGRPAPG